MSPERRPASRPKKAADRNTGARPALTSSTDGDFHVEVPVTTQPVAELGPRPEPFVPDWSLSAGVLLRKELAERGMTQADLSQRTGLSPKHINQIVKEAASLSPDVALRLERALGTASSTWLAVEAQWQAARAAREAAKTLADHVDWARRFPIKDLVRRGVLTGAEQGSALVEAILRLFQVANPAALEQVWLQPVAGFRRSQQHDVDLFATITWLRLGEIAATGLELKPWNPARLRAALPKLRGLTREPDEIGFRHAQELLGKCGVAAVFVPEVAGSRACGATRWRTDGKPLVVLSGRYRYADSFWFTLFHELAHVLLHPRRSTFVDLDGQYGDDQDGQESQANEYAADILLPTSYRSRLAAARRANQIVGIAAEAGIDAGIAAGQHGHLTKNWRTGSRLRHPLSLEPGGAA